MIIVPESQGIIEVKALTLWQPWASLLIGGFKTYETRSWRPALDKPTRFWLAIHAAKREPSAVFHRFNKLYPSGMEALTWECLDQMGYVSFPQLPRGAVLGLALLGTIRPVEELRGRVDARDAAFGDWSDGRFAWRIAKVWQFADPVPARGAQGLWKWQMPRELSAQWLDGEADTVPSRLQG